MSQLLTLDDTGKLTLANVMLSNVGGNIVHSGSYTIFGDSTINGTLNVDTIYAKKIINGSTETSSDVGNWVGQQESDINGTGVQWTWGRGSTQLIYRTGNRLWTNASLDLSQSSTYKIDGTDVLTSTELGPTITKSNLKQLGKLSTLEVSNNATLGDFAFFNSDFGRLGLGNPDPSLAIDIIENNVNIAVGSPGTSQAYIGTISNHDVDIVTDNIPRITVKNSGEVVIGDAESKNGSLRVNGTLYAEAVITDTRVDRTSPLQFQATNNQTIYGLGLIWQGTGASRQLIMRNGPDRLWSSESIDVADDKGYYIGGQLSLTSTSLGVGITESNLTSVGILNGLNVSGDTVFQGILTANNVTVNGSITLGTLSINNTGIANVIYGDNSSIELGVPTNNRKPIKLFGPVSVNINNPDPDVQFSVNGDIKVADRRFTNGTSAPAQGTYELGDICWNTKPQVGNYIGWVCVSAGNPGIWASFGAII